MYITVLSICLILRTQVSSPEHTQDHQLYWVKRTVLLVVAHLSVENRYNLKCLFVEIENNLRILYLESG